MPSWIFWVSSSCGYITILLDLVLPAALSKRYHPHVSDEKTETQGDQNLLRATHQVDKRAFLLYPTPRRDGPLSHGTRGPQGFFLAESLHLPGSWFMSFTLWLLDGSIFKICKVQTQTQLGSSETGELHYLITGMWTSYLSWNIRLVHSCLSEGQLCIPYFIGFMPLGS